MKDRTKENNDRIAKLKKDQSEGKEYEGQFGSYHSEISFLEEDNARFELMKIKGFKFD